MFYYISFHQKEKVEKMSSRSHSITAVKKQLKLSSNTAYFQLRYSCRAKKKKSMLVILLLLFSRKVNILKKKLCLNVM